MNQHIYTARYIPAPLYSTRENIKKGASSKTGMSRINERKATERSIDATEIRADATERSSDATEIRADATEISADETERSTDATERSSDATEKSTDKRDESRINENGISKDGRPDGRNEHHPLFAISTVDGRDYRHTRKLRIHFSEYAFLRAAVFVEAEYLIFLSEEEIIRLMSSGEKSLLRGLAAHFTLGDAEIISAIEHGGYRHRIRHEIPATNHDVKAVEYFIRLRIEETTLADLIPMIHFCLTSEDVKNLALNVMLRGFRNKEYVPALAALLDQLAALARTHARTPMKARTHGQPASPTTLGKECAVFLDRLLKQLCGLCVIRLSGKLNGATGNYNAHQFLLPHLPWTELSGRFVTRLGFAHSAVTTQIEPADSLIALLHQYKRINLVLLNLCQDTWQYLSDGYLRLVPAAHEVGSSTMPHKVNPIGIEHAEGALKKSSALLQCFDTLAVSRLQRDLSDSTVKRDIGLALAYSYEAVLCLTRTLSAMAADSEKMARELDEEYSVLAEAVQVFLRKKGCADAYEMVKKETRGRSMTSEEYRALIRRLPLNDGERGILEMLRPETYLGIAPELAERAAADWEETKAKWARADTAREKETGEKKEQGERSGEKGA